MDTKTIIEIGGGIASLVAVALASWFRKSIWALLRKIGRGILSVLKMHRAALVKMCLTADERKRLYPGTDTFGLNRVRQYMHIDQILTTLLDRTNADRAYIFKFHNGAYFSPDEPIWKMSNSSEICKPHIRYYSSELQDIKISLVVNIVGPLLLGNLDNVDVGVRRIPHCAKCPLNYECTGRHMYMVDVDASKASHMKQLWQNRGIKHTIVCNLQVRGHSVGIMGVDYCRPITEPIDTKQLCEAAERVQFLLSQKQE